MEEVNHSSLKQWVSKSPFRARVVSCGYFSEQRRGFGGSLLPHDFLIFELKPGIYEEDGDVYREWSFLRVERMAGGEIYHLGLGIDAMCKNLCGCLGEVPVLHIKILLEPETRLGTWGPTSSSTVRKSGVTSTMYLDDVLQFQEFASRFPYRVVSTNCWFFAAAVLHSIVENQHWEYTEHVTNPIVKGGMVRREDLQFQKFHVCEVGAEYVRLFVLRAILRMSAVSVPNAGFRQRVTVRPVVDIFVRMKCIRLLHFRWRREQGRGFLLPVVEPADWSEARKLAWKEGLRMSIELALVDALSGKRLDILSTQRLARLYGKHVLDRIR